MHRGDLEDLDNLRIRQAAGRDLRDGTDERRTWACAHRKRSADELVLAEAMALTGHRSVQRAVRYFQTGAVAQFPEAIQTR